MPLCNTYFQFTNIWDINKHMIDLKDTYKFYYNSVDIFNFWPLTEVNCLYSTLALVNTRILWLTNISSNKNNLDQIYTTHSAQHFYWSPVTMMPMLFKVHLGQLDTNSVYEKNTKILPNTIPSADRNITECGKKYSTQCIVSVELKTFQERISTSLKNIFSIIWSSIEL